MTNEDANMRIDIYEAIKDVIPKRVTKIDSIEYCESEQMIKIDIIIGYI